jgi:exonuclease III
MRFLFWNVRGLGKSSRKQQVKEFIEEHKLQMVGLQETMKDSFSGRDLLDLAGIREFTWQWIPPKGKSGGILMGVCLETLELEDFSIHVFCIVMDVRDRRSNFRWRFITVYGPARHDLSVAFIDELKAICALSTLPVILGGDFNLIREASDKNSENIDLGLINLFNEFIGDLQLRELKRSGQRYSWTNKRSNPIMVNLDRVLFSVSWEDQFPLSLSWGLTRVGSDHIPIIVDNGESLPSRPRYFFYEQQWAKEPNFSQLVIGKLMEAGSRCPEQCYSLDRWHGSLALLKSFLKGWNIQKMGE